MEPLAKVVFFTIFGKKFKSLKFGFSQDFVTLYIKIYIFYRLWLTLYYAFSII
jgi:hypothetical protein